MENFRFLRQCFENTPVYIKETNPNIFHLLLDYPIINIHEDIIIEYKDNKYIGKMNNKKWKTFDNEYYAFKMIYHRCDVAKIERIIRKLIFSQEFDFPEFCKKYLKDHPEIKSIKDLKAIH